MKKIYLLFVLLAFATYSSAWQCVNPPLITGTNRCLGSDTLRISAIAGVTSLYWYFNGLAIDTVNSSSYVVTTAAGGNGQGSSHNQLAFAYGVFVDKAGDVYAADPGNNRVLRFPAGSNSNTNGTIVAGGNGSGSAANQLNSPFFAFVDGSGYLYVSDCNNYRVQKFPPGSDSTTNGVTVAGGNLTGSADNQIGGPRGIYVDASGNLFVADKYNNRIMKFPAGSTSATYATIAAGGNGLGNDSNQFNGPRGIWFDSGNNMYVADYTNDRVQKFPPGSDSTSMGVTVAGGNGTGSNANQFNKPYGVYLDRHDNLFVVDVYNNRVMEFPPGSDTTTNGVIVAGGNGQGNAMNQLNEPAEVMIDSTGNIYVSDYNNDRIQKFSPYIADTFYVPTQPGNYTATYGTASGCISYLSDTLIVFPVLYTTVNQTICQGNGYYNHTATGTYIDTLTGINGCDSIRTLSLLVNPRSYSNISQTICEGDTFFKRTTTGVFIDTLTSANSCDSIRTLNLTVNPIVIVSISQTICQGDTFEGKTGTGTYIDTLTGSNGCDSIHTLNLTVNPITTSIISQTICAGDTFLGRTATGTFIDTLSNANGCDSIRTLNLTVNPILISTTNKTICQGDTFWGRVATGVFIDTLNGSNGCDSIRTLNLTVNPISLSSLSQTICQGDSFLGRKTMGIYIDTLSNYYGCDSIRSLNLAVNPISISNITQAICQGDSFFGRSATGVYADTLTGSKGCDSIRILSLTVNPTKTSRVNQSMCAGTAYLFNNDTLTSAGIYIDTLNTWLGCDSIVTLNLAINNILQTSITDTICVGIAFMFNGNGLSQSGVYLDTLQSVAGCDSIVTLSLIVDSLSVPLITRNGDSLQTGNFSSYQWLLNGAVIVGATQQNMMFTQNGNYSVVVTNVFGCSDTSEAITVTGVGITENGLTTDVKIYPNPNTGKFILEFTNQEINEVEITDVIGKVMLRSINVERQKQFDLEELPAGIYILHITQNHAVKSLKFSVVKD